MSQSYEHSLKEMQLARRLRANGADIFQGDTTIEIRKAKARTEIQRSGLAQAICGRGVDRKPRTFADAFQSVYGEAL